MPRNIFPLHPIVSLSSNQIRERCLPLLRESQSLLPPLEEMEKNITGFYQALEKASRITGSRDSEGPGDFKLKCQVWDEYEFTEQAFFLMNVQVSSCHGTCASNGQSVSWFYFLSSGIVCHSFGYIKFSFLN